MRALSQNNTWHGQNGTTPLSLAIFCNARDLIAMFLEDAAADMVDLDDATTAGQVRAELDKLRAPPEQPQAASKAASEEKAPPDPAGPPQLALMQALHEARPHALLCKIDARRHWTRAGLLCLRAALMVGSVDLVQQLLGMASFAAAQDDTIAQARSETPGAGKVGSANAWAMLPVTVICEEACAFVGGRATPSSDASDGAAEAPSGESDKHSWQLCRERMASLGHQPPDQEKRLLFVRLLVSRRRTAPRVGEIAGLPVAVAACHLACVCVVDAYWYVHPRNVRLWCCFYDLLHRLRRA